MSDGIPSVPGAFLFGVRRSALLTSDHDNDALHSGICLLGAVVAQSLSSLLEPSVVAGESPYTAAKYATKSLSDLVELQCLFMPFVNIKKTW